MADTTSTQTVRLGPCLGCPPITNCPRDCYDLPRTLYWTFSNGTGLCRCLDGRTAVMGYLSGSSVSVRWVGRMDTCDGPTGRVMTLVFECQTLADGPRHQASFTDQGAGCFSSTGGQYMTVLSTRPFVAQQILTLTGSCCSAPGGVGVFTIVVTVSEDDPR